MKNRKKKEELKLVDTAARDRVAGYIAAGILKLQRNWAASMSKFMTRLSPGQQVFFLFAFMLLLGGWSCWTLFGGKLFVNDGVFRHEQLQLEIPVHQIRLTNDSLLSQRLNDVRVYLDSIQRTADGKPLWDSFLMRNKGLIDSLYELEYFSREDRD